MRALARIKLNMDGILDTIREGRKTTALLDRLDALEAEQIEIRTRLAKAPADVPDIPAIYARKVAQLAKALGMPGERSEAAEALRGLIEQVALSPGAKRGEVLATLHGEFGTILEWVGQNKAGQTKTPGLLRAGSVWIIGCGDPI